MIALKTPPTVETWLDRDIEIRPGRSRGIPLAEVRPGGYHMAGLLLGLPPDQVQPGRRVKAAVWLNDYETKIRVTGETAQGYGQVYNTAGGLMILPGWEVTLRVTNHGSTGYITARIRLGLVRL